MNLERVKDLLDLMSSSSVKELMLIDNTGEIRLRRDLQDAPTSIATSLSACSHTVTQHTSEINAPLPGILYLSPSPNAPPYVTVGSAVKKGDTVALIEAMKTMVPVTATEDGTVTVVFAKNETSVDSTQKLFNITPAVE